MAAGRLHDALDATSAAPILDQLEESDAFELAEVVVETLALQPQARGDGAGGAGLAEGRGCGGGLRTTVAVSGSRMISTRGSSAVWDGQSGSMASTLRQLGD